MALGAKLLFKWVNEKEARADLGADAVDFGTNSVFLWHSKKNVGNPCPLHKVQANGSDGSI